MIVLRGGQVLDWGARTLAPVDLLLDGGTIAAMGPPGMEAPVDAEVVAVADRLLVPGLVNAHTHAHGGLGKGLVDERVPLEMFLADAPAVNAGRNAEDKYLSALVSAVEMLRKGCTACYDLAVDLPVPTEEGMHAVARAYRDAGMRAVVAPMMADRTLYQALPGLLDAMPPALGEKARALTAAPCDVTIAACERILARWPFDRDQVAPALGPTIPLHCSDEFLVACHRLSREHGVALQTHLAETKAQARLAQVRYGESLVAHLARLGVLDERASAAHAIWIDDDDIARLADAGVKVAHNPLSNLRLGSGVAPVRRMLQRGVRVGIGTDAANTSDGQNCFEATRLAAYLSRLVTPERLDWLSTAEAFTLATEGSAAVLGFGDRLGRLAPGFKADIVFLDLAHINYVPLGDPGTQLVYGESGAAVTSVMVDGRFVIRDGVLLTVDEQALRRNAQQALERLQRANAGQRDAGRALADVVGAFCLGQSRAHHHVHRTLHAADYA